MPKEYEWIKLEKGIRCRKHPTRKHGIKADVYYVLRFSVDGKMVQEALGWASEGITLARARVELAKLREAKRSGLGARSLREKRQKVEAERRAEEKAATETQENLITVGEFWETEYQPAQSHKSEGSIVAEKNLWKKWIAPKIATLPLRLLNPSHLEPIKACMISEQKAEATIKYAMAVISQVWTHAERMGLVNSPSPTKQVVLPKKDNKRQRYLSKDEADQLLSVLKSRSPVTHDMSILALDCGLRFGEIAALTWGDCDLNRRQLFIRDPKARANRFAFMTERVYQVLSSIPRRANSELIFPDINGKKMERISNSFRKTADELFNQNVSDLRLRVCFHTLRHTFASRLVNSGVSLYEVKELMGHSDFSMTQRYSHLSPEGLRTAIKNLEED